MATKAADNPPELSPHYASRAFSAGPWFVICTNPKCEKALASHISEYFPQIPYFLPYITRRSSSRNLIHNPLFTGYMFAAAPPSDEITTTYSAATNKLIKFGGPVLEQLAVLQPVLDILRNTRYVFDFLFTFNQPKFISELALLAANPSTARGVTTRDHYKQGTPVEIMTGPFKGIKGRLAASSSLTNPILILEIEFFNQYITVTIPSESIRIEEDGDKSFSPVFRRSN